MKTKLGQAVLKAGESDELRQLDELHHRLKLNRKDLKVKPTSNEAHQYHNTNAFCLQFNQLCCLGRLNLVAWYMSVNGSTLAPIVSYPLMTIAIGL